MTRLLLFFALCATAAAQDLTVSAAISLKDALDKIAPLFEAENPGARVIFNFGSSGALQQQIQNGAPVDIFISAADRQIDALEKEGLLVPGTRRVVLTNELVLIAPKETALPEDFQGLTDPEIGKIAMGEPKSVPAGQYASEVLSFFQLGDALRERLVYAKDVRQVLVYVESKNAGAGIVYASDAAGSPKVRVVAAAPKNSHSPIVYPAAVIEDSRHLQLARRFLDFLASPDAREIFRNAGFQLP